MRGLSRFWLFASSAVLVCAELAPAGHALLVRHVVCAEHGEATHATAPDDGAVAPPDDARSAVASTTASDDEHEHCRMVVLRGRAAHSHSELAVRLAPPPALLDPSRDAAPPAIAVFRLAPKSSPPIAG